LEQGLGLLSLQPAQLAEGGEGTARACSILRALPTIRLGKKYCMSMSRHSKNSRGAP